MIQIDNPTAFLCLGLFALAGGLATYFARRVSLLDDEKATLKGRLLYYQERVARLQLQLESIVPPPPVNVVPFRRPQYGVVDVPVLGKINLDKPL